MENTRSSILHLVTVRFSLGFASNNMVSTIKQTIVPITPSHYTLLNDLELQKYLRLHPEVKKVFVFYRILIKYTYQCLASVPFGCPVVLQFLWI
jgi:hypothetical protein